MDSRKHSWTKGGLLRALYERELSQAKCPKTPNGEDTAAAPASGAHPEADAEADEQVAQEDAADGQEGEEEEPAAEDVELEDAVDKVEEAPDVD